MAGEPHGSGEQLPRTPRRTAALTDERTLRAERPPAAGPQPAIADGATWRVRPAVAAMAAALALTWALLLPSPVSPVPLWLASEPPGARVLVDGADSGLVTPAQLRYVSSARMTVRLQPPAVPAAVSLPPVPAPAPPATVSSPAPAVRRRAAMLTPTGRLSIRTLDAWADVYLGKAKIGTTPIQEVVLPAGRHELVLENSVVGLRKTERVQVVQGEHVRLTVEMRTNP